MSTGEPLRDLVVTFILSGTLEVEGKKLPIERSFRLRDGGGLEILWELDNAKTFVYLFDPGDFGQGIRDSNCALGEECTCSLEERRLFVESVGLVVPASAVNYISPEFDVFVRF